MIGSYGQDDRVCSFAALQGLFDAEETPETHRRVYAGGQGGDRLRGRQRDAVSRRSTPSCPTCATPRAPACESCYENSFCLSADVTAAFDPNFAEVYEKHNAACLNHGVGLCKYTGARGKSGASDACCRGGGLCAQAVRTSNGILWQIVRAGQGGRGRRRHRGSCIWPIGISTPSTLARRCWPCTRPSR